jgi:threonine aldolase
MPARRGFASDNASTIHPEILDAIAAANQGHSFGYGHDPLTERLAGRFNHHFGPRAVAFPVWSGTGANVLCLRAACWSSP